GGLRGWETARAPRKGRGGGPPGMSNGDPGGWRGEAPFPTLISPPVQLAVPLFALTSSRPLLSVLLDPLSVMPACAVVLPPPSMVPPLQVSAPLTVTASVPWSVPAESARLGSVIPPPVLKSTVAAPITSGPTLVTEPVKFTVPAVAMVLPVTAEGPETFVGPPLQMMVVPVTLPLTF